MLAQKPDTTASVAQEATIPPTTISEHVRELGDWLGTSSPSPRRPVAAAYPTPAASPEFRSYGDSFDDASPLVADDLSFGDYAAEPLFGGEEYFTSPLFDDLNDFAETSPMDTPFSEFLETPLMRDEHDFSGNSPLIAAGDLFGGTLDDPAPIEKPVAQEKHQLWTMSGTPVIEPAGNVFPAPTTKSVVPDAPRYPMRERPSVNGTRKHLTPDALIPLDAPTQKRNYMTPSATSRKVITSAIAKKRAHSEAFADADEEELAALSPTASEAERIEHKRRQNTIAARRSRKRKLAHKLDLEGTVADLQADVARWRERALMAQDMLRVQGVTFSFE
ncbi:hypothetical protein B0H15DRAFT_774444 [Mycena belliarum]|uniref:BZIP domain-containing protein n=1 Tax=Mycena belliarum TaxID=1033014 RepID=A0AAD6XVR4_9AGAR|nr:hypothetical protein B0H15DRAFT_774444 [Mycena belliae]